MAGRPLPHRTISLRESLRHARSREEQETLLADCDDHADEYGLFYGVPGRLFDLNPHGHLPVYTSIHRIRRLVLASIDDPYTLDQLKSPRLNTKLVRPLVDRLYDPEDVSVVYCLLVNRMQFLRDQSHHHHHQTVNLTRATLCELLASRVLRRFDVDNEGRAGLLLLANMLVAGFEPFQNAPGNVLQTMHGSIQSLPWSLENRGGHQKKLTALEVAIISESKLFLSTTACQKVIEGVYRGRIVYTPTTFIDILPDYYKHKPVSLYDPRRAPILNQYRLIVPRTRNILEIFQFILLLILYIITMVHRDDMRFNGYELCFVIYAAGWVLDEFASMLEHGWHVHTQNLWSFLDITFVGLFVVYFFLRMAGLMTGNVDASRQALDVLCICAPILLPRLAFSLMPENMLFIALRAMMADFMALTMIGVWCFAGFLLAMKWLSRWNSPENDEDASDPITISKWMLWIWFGLDGTGIPRSVEFHLILGPVLMITFAFLGNTLFLTVLVSMLSNTFSRIAANPAQEIQFRRAVLTFEGVKSDSIFAYRPPTNILALCLLLPLKACLTARWFHKVNVAAVKLLNAPILLVITLYERHNLWAHRSEIGDHTSGPSKRNSWMFAPFNRFTVHGDIQAVFDAECPQRVIEEFENEEEGGSASGSGSGSASLLESGFGLRVGEQRRRRWSEFSAADAD